MPTFMETIFGQNPHQGSSFNKGQQSYMDSLLSQLQGMQGQGDITQNQNFQGGSDWLNNLFSNDPEFWNKFEAPIKRQYEEETIPSLANRFASMGSGGSLGSTAFRNQLGREGSNLQTNLSALRGGMQQQGVGQALQYGQQPIQNMMGFGQQALNPTNNVPFEGNGGIAAPLLGMLAKVLGSYYGAGG